MKPFALSCTTCATRGIQRDEILSCFEYAPKAGYKYWGLAGPPLWDLGGARWFDAESVTELAEQAGLVGLTEVYGPVFPTESIDAAIHAAEDIALMFDLATRLTCPLVVITGGSRRTPEFLRATIEGLKELLRILPENSPRLALEPHFFSAIERRSDYEAIFSEIDDPRLGMTVDNGHLHMAREDWVGMIRDFSSKVINVHVKDHWQYVSVPLGKGEIDIRAGIEALARVGYKGVLAVELEVMDPQNLPTYIGDARSFLTEIVRDVTGTEPE